MANDTKRPALGERPDGRLYSRITRRCVAILKHVRAGRTFDLITVAREVANEAYPEFLVTRDDELRPIGPERIRDYLSYLVDLDLIQGSGGQYRLNFVKPSRDPEWAQALSDTAREHLSPFLNVSTANVPDKLEAIRSKSHKLLRVPTIAAVVAETGIEGARRLEMFRWSLYLYTDGDACPLEIRQYPHIGSKA